MESDWLYPEEHPQTRRSFVLPTIRLGFIVAILSFVFALMIPLYQRGVNRSLVLEYRSLQHNHQSLAEQQQLLRASISSLQMPESLIDDAWREEIMLIPITDQSIYSVARSSL